MIELIDADEGSSVLDLGCGNGALTKALKDKGYLAEGLDASGELLDIAKEKYPDIDFMQGDAVDFTLSEPVDVAIMLESAAFGVQYAVLFDRLTELKGENGLKDWINMFVKKPFLIVKTEQEKAEIVDKAVKALRNDLLINGKWYADYVRIRMKAVRL